MHSSSGRIRVPVSALSIAAAALITTTATAAELIGFALMPENRFVSKTELVDLMNISDPHDLKSDNPEFLKIRHDSPLAYKPADRDENDREDRDDEGKDG